MDPCVKEGELPFPFSIRLRMIRNTFPQPTVISERKIRGAKQDHVTALWKEAFTPSTLHLSPKQSSVHSGPWQRITKILFSKGQSSTILRTATSKTPRKKKISQNMQTYQIRGHCQSPQRIRRSVQEQCQAKKKSPNFFNFKFLYL